MFLVRGSLLKTKFKTKDYLRRAKKIIGFPNSESTCLIYCIGFGVEDVVPLEFEVDISLFHSTLIWLIGLIKYDKSKS
ncbi:MAG: hypothetical protein JEY97_02385 [Bacteroidales bacterium]|nr:hypothetical protein [Bacteroidales bacterium]